VAYYFLGHPVYTQQSQKNNTGKQKHESTQTIQGGQKTWHTLFVNLNFVKYCPIFKLISLSESGYLVNISVLKATVENKTTSVTTHFNSASSTSKADILNI